MRKDVKLGFAIGGVFLAVLVVYVLVISGGPPTPDPVVLDTPPATAPPRNVPAPLPTKEPAPELIAAPNIPAAPPATLPQATPEPIKEVAAAASTGNTTNNWGEILDKGLQPMQTKTPDPKVSEPGGAEAGKPLNLVTGAADTLPLLMPGPAAPKPAGAETTPITHVIKPGENFSNIAAMYYGSASYYSHILRANPTVDPRHLKIGSTINLPPVDQVRADKTAAPTAAVAPALNSTSEYRVEPGDNLNKISIKLYGKADRVDKIYELNQAVIGPKKESLKIGMVLKLPEAPMAR